MTTPAKTIKITIRENEYEIPFPNTRTFINIEARKQQLTDGNFDSIASSFDGTAHYTSLLVSAIATFENILPKAFWESLNVKSLGDLGPAESVHLVIAYRDIYLPWQNAWMDLVAEILKPKEAEKATA